jgi:hypothetical protein
MKTRDGKGVSTVWFMEKVEASGDPVRSRL